MQRVRWGWRWRTAPAALTVILLMTGCSSGSPSLSSATAAATTGPRAPGAGPTPPRVAFGSPGPSPPASPSASPSGVPAGASVRIDPYASSRSGRIGPALAGIPARVYVPDETTNDVTVIDPATFRIINRFRVGQRPEHITPDWSGQRLFVENMGASTLTIIDARTGLPTGIPQPMPHPYNLYFTLDGTTAMDVQDFLNAAGLPLNGLRFYDRRTWRETGWLPIPFSGANHLDLSADGSFAMLSGETSGVVGKVDLVHRTLTGMIVVGGSPTDVRLSPDGRLFFNANQGTNGVDILDPATMRRIGFIATGAGAHGLALSRDTKQLYVTNRLAGSLSVIDIATRRVVATWRIGGSPDMVSLSPDGRQLWISNRYNGSVVVVDAGDGRVLATIATGGSPHGLCYWPQPGDHSIGHNGNMR